MGINLEIIKVKWCCNYSLYLAKAMQIHVYVYVNHFVSQSEPVSSPSKPIFSIPSLTYKSQARTPLSALIIINFRCPSSPVSRLKSRSGRVQSRYKRSSRGIQSRRTLHSSRLGKPLAPSIPHVWRHHTTDHEVVELFTYIGMLKPISCWPRPRIGTKHRGVKALINEWVERHIGYF